MQSRRHRRAASRFFRNLLKEQGGERRRLITDRLRSDAAAHRTRQYETKRADRSHQPTRQRER